MANRLKKKMDHRRKVKILGICWIGSLLIALIMWELLWTNTFESMSWYGISARVALAVMRGSFFSSPVLGICFVIELTKHRSWSHKMMVECRILLIVLLLAGYVGLNMLAVNRIESQFDKCCSHIEDFGDTDEHDPLVEGAEVVFYDPFKTKNSGQ